MPEDIHEPPERPAWGALIAHIQHCDALPAGVIRAAYLEHKRLEEQRLQTLLSECCELRDDWLIDAEIIKPLDQPQGPTQIANALDKHAKASKPPLIPRHPWIARIPFIRRFFR